MSKAFTLAFIIFLNLNQLGFAQQYDGERASGTNFAHRPGTFIKAPDDSMSISIKGSGEIPVILISGMDFGGYIYDSFVERNYEKAEFHIITPPGLGSTPAYPWPEQAEDFQNKPWVNTFKDELITYIENEFEQKVYLISFWDPGLNVNLHLANEYPEKIGGLLMIGPGRSFPHNRWYQRTEENKDVIFDQQAQIARFDRVINFARTVSEIAWYQSTFTAQSNLFTKEDSLDYEYRLASVRQPFNIALRYFLEVTLDDISEELRRINVPIKSIVVMPSMSSIKSFIHVTNPDPEATPQQEYKAIKRRTIRDFHAPEKEYVDVTFVDAEESGFFVWIDQPEIFDRIFDKLIKD